MLTSFTQRARRFVLTVVVLGGSILPASATRLDAQQGANPSPLGATVGGVLGGTVGFIAGAFIGGSQCDELCIEIVTGAIVGEMLGLPLGAHLGNGYKGNVFADLGVSIGVGGLGVLLADGVENGEGAVLLLAALAQVVGVVVTEVRTSPRLNVSPTVGPTPAGVRVGMEVRW